MHPITIPQLDAPDAVLSLGGVDLTVRHLIVLILAGLLWIVGWSTLAALPLAVHVIGTLVPVLVLLVGGCLRMGGRSLEGWVPVLLRAWCLPARLVWSPEQPFRDEEGSRP